MPQHNKKGMKNSAVREARPPPMRANIEITHKYRFKAVSYINGLSITDADLLLAAGAFQATTVLAYPIFQTVKVKRVEIWAPVASQGTATTCSVEWPSTNQSQEREIADTSVSVTYPAHVSAVPPKNSLAGFWNNAVDGNFLFSLVMPIGSVIDVTLALTLNDGDAAGASLATALSTVGEVNYAGLDGLPKASTLLMALGLTPA
jgi:hypothetical protein